MSEETKKVVSRFQTEKKWSFPSYDLASAKKAEFEIENDVPRVRIRKRQRGASFDVVLLKPVKVEMNTEDLTETE
jgi:hypothetical protein